MPGVNVVCVGAGWVTTERHVPALRGDGRARILGVVDAHGERAAAAARAAGAPHSGTSLEEPWLADATCLTLGAPPLAHAGLIRQGLEHGWHVLSEKPLTLPARHARDLVALARERDLVLAVVHNFQFSRSGSRLFALAEGGELGEVEAVYGFQLSNPERRLPHWYPDLPGGLFADEAPHLLYLMRRLLGGRLDVRTVDARLDGTEIRDVVATFEHDTVWATLSMSFRAALSEWQLVVVGRRAVAALDVFRDVLVVLPNDRGHRAREILRTSAALVGGHLAGVATSGTQLLAKRLLYGNDEVVRRFLDAVEGRRERLAWISGEDGQAVVEALETLVERAGVPVI